MQKVSVVVREAIMILLSIMPRLLRPCFLCVTLILSAIMWRLLRPYFRIRLSPPCTSTYRVKDWVNGIPRAHVLSIWLWGIRFDHSPHLTSLFASHPIHPSATLCTSHIWTPSLPSLPPLPFLSLTLQWHTYKYTTQLSRRRWWIHPSVLRIIIIKARACEVWHSLSPYGSRQWCKEEGEGCRNKASVTAAFPPTKSEWLLK